MTDDDKCEPKPETRRCCAYIALAVGGAVASVVAICDVRGDGVLTGDHATLKDIYPSWLLAISLVLVLLKLISTFPEWSDPRSKKVAPWIKFIADAAALAAAAYAALIAVLFASLPTVTGWLGTPVGATILAIVFAVVVSGLTTCFLLRQEKLDSERRQVET